MEVENNEPVVLRVRLLKWRLRNDHRREIRYFHEIIDLTRNIANSFENDEKNKRLTHNLNHELNLRKIIDYHIKRIYSHENATEISSALTEIRVRKHCFDQQSNFVNMAINYGETNFVYPDHLLSMSFERQRLIYKHIFKKNYPTLYLLPKHGAGPTFDGPQPMEQVSHDTEETSNDSSDSDSEPLPEPNQEESNANQVAQAINPASQSLEEQNSQKDGDNSNEKTENIIHFQVVDDSLLYTPGCSKWTTPRPNLYQH